MLLKPALWINNVFEIDETFLVKNGIKGLILDLDNTLSMHGNPAAEEGVFEWLAEMRRLNVEMIVVSNNTAKRVAPLAKQLRLEFISFGCKPLPFRLNKAARKTSVPKNALAVVGDQIFTDVIGGNLTGIKTILVEPFHLEDGRFFRFKRHLEGLVFKRDYSKLNKSK